MIKVSLCMFCDLGVHYKIFIAMFDLQVMIIKFYTIVK